MTLRAMLAKSPALFYQPLGTTPPPWFHNEAFLDTLAEESRVTPKGLRDIGLFPTPGDPNYPLAVELIQAYVTNPTASVWRWFHNCRDVDRNGCLIYIGGVGYDDRPGLQIHRELRPDKKRGTSRW